MAYQYITKHDAINYDKGRGGNKIKYIVIHHWDDPSRRPSFNGVINWFCYNRSCQTSCHYVVEGGRVACIVDEANTAWHAGNYRYNQQSIGIECSPYMTKADLETIGELVAGILDYHGNLTILNHKDIVNTGCPGKYYPAAKVLAPYIAKYRGKSQYNKGSTTTAKPAPKPTPAPAPKPAAKPATSINKQAVVARLLSSYLVIKRGDRGDRTKAMQELLKLKGYSLDCDGIFGTDTEKQVKAFQKAQGITADGMAGADTLSRLVV